MNKNNVKRFAALLLSAAMLLALTACGGKGTKGPSEALKGVYDALVAPDSEYSQTKEFYREWYPEVEYAEALENDRFTLSMKANGNEYLTDGSWTFVQEGDYLTFRAGADDFTALTMALEVIQAVASYLGMDADLTGGYVNGLSAMGWSNDDFTMADTEDGGTSFRINMAKPWKMEELDQMVLGEPVMDYDPLNTDYVSQFGSVGKMRVYMLGSSEYYEMLFAEYGELDEIAYQSIVNMVKLREPQGWEEFLTEFTALKELETDAYSVSFDVDETLIEERFNEVSDKYRYALVTFGTEESYEDTDFAFFVPEADDFADAYFRVVSGFHQGVAGAFLAETQAACDVLSFAAYNWLWEKDVDTVRANMLEAWESLSDEERASFDENFPGLDELLKNCFTDWDATRARFEDIEDGVEMMEDLMSIEGAAESWEMLSANTWTLGNSDQ